MTSNMTTTVSGNVAGLRTERVQVSGQQVTYRVAGSGEPVVLVHGLAGSARWWVNTIPALASRYRVYLVDLPGFGSMSGFPGGFALDQAASWLLAWIRALGLQPVRLAGHSMGGFICLHVAARNPSGVVCLALIDPAGMPTGRSTLGHFWPLVQECLLSSPNLLPMLLRDALRAGPLTLWRAARDLLAQDVRADLHAVKMPTLIVWGERDALVPPSLGRVLHEELAGSQLLTIKGARHVPMFDTPDELNRALLAFFGDQPGLE